MNNDPGARAASYKGVESLDQFPTQEEIETYRTLQRERSTDQADFIIDRLSPGARVLDVGCGNGRLLVELGLRHAIDGGLGIDLAQSRIQFARKWAEDAGLVNVKFEAADALRYPLPERGFGAVICTGSTLAYCGVTRGTDAQLLERLHTALEPGSPAVFEFMAHPRERRRIEASGGELRTWYELPDGDPWRFYLMELSVTDDVLTSNKVFVHRTSGEIDEGRTDRIRLYSTEELSDLLITAGFEDVRFSGGWTEREYRDDDLMVVTGRAKPST